MSTEPQHDKLTFPGKSIFATKSFAGLVLVFLSHFIPKLAPFLSTQENRDTLTDLILQTIQGVMFYGGQVLALVGRITATQRISLTPIVRTPAVPATETPVEKMMKDE